MAGKRIGLFDLDGLVYAAACVTETVYHEVDGIKFDYKSQANEHCDENNIPRTEIVEGADAQPVAHAFAILNDMIPANLKAANCDVGEFYLTPSEKDADHPFRFDIYPDYKANRRGKRKPTHLKALRAHAVKNYGAMITSHMEADDMIAIRAKEIEASDDDFVIISRDKDLFQIHGDFFNHETKKAVTVTISEAQRNLFTQVLVGDTVDNIKGCPKIGPAKAKKALLHAENEEEMLGVCQWLYTQAHKGNEADAMIDLRLNFRLVRMITNRSDAHA